ncbi:hypothetical protein P7C71_g3401, partial [Lecanoromycetidae sp. Uapishka_2]
MSTPIPRPPGVFLLGNIFDVDPSNTWVSLKKLADKYGPIFKIKVLTQEIVFVGSVSLLEEICDEKRFRKCVIGPIVEVRQAVHDALFTAYDYEASWGIAHRIMAPMLSPSSVEATFNGMRESASKLVAKWASSGEGLRIEAREDLRRLNLEAVMLCLFDERLDCLSGPELPVMNALDNVPQECMLRPNRPRLLNWLFYQRSFNSGIETMRKFAADVVAKRRSQPDPKKDMLYTLMHTQDPETGKQLDEQRIIDEVVTIIIGTTTCPGLLAFAVYYLLQNTHCITKAREEIDAVVGPEENPLTHSHLAKLPYCDAILKESIRLSAAAPGFNIEPLPSTKGPTTLAGGKYQIPPKQPIIAILAAVNRDPTVFDEPEAFRPERMMPEAFKDLPRGAQKWFGNGKRECIGKVYAWQWAMVTLVSLVRGVDLEMADEGYEMKVDGAFNLK